MQARRFLFAAAALTVLTACSSDDSSIENNEGRVPVKLSYTNIDAVETRAAQNLNEGTFASGESVKVRVSNTGVGEWSDYTFTTGSAGAMTPGDPAPYYPAGAQNIDIVAYYPATAGTSFSVATNQTADDDYKASDLMFASVTDQAKQAAPVNLNFAHKMAKLNVNVTTGQGVSSITSVSLLQVKPTVSFDQATGAVGEASGDAATIAISNQGAAVIPAQTIDGGLLSIETDKGTATYSISNKAFTAGNLYTMNITVNLRAVGTTTDITGWISEGTVTVNPVMKDMTPDGVEAIDMGNGLKWANMNVGATTVSDYGDYFAWGATRPFYVTHDAYGNEIAGHWIDGKTGYNWENYASYDYADDAARQNWGGNWRTPTDAEWTWLRENCDWLRTTHNGVSGVYVQSKVDGYTDKIIFLPAAGRRYDNNLVNAGSGGYYWSSSLSENNSANAMYVKFYFDSEGFDVNGGIDSRFFGQSVRPVTE